MVDDNLKWQRDVQNHFSTMLGNPGSYYNFPDPGLENHATAYWGNNLPRLMQVKVVTIRGACSRRRETEFSLEPQ